ncbi:ATP-binding protein [Rathayibacter tritici]|uniref:ATP-binding protein n=1 Tax=Rathayibacter tritici TaxID=33888 RepID=UPI0021585FE1|nr:ATP-binding protein [Rathayibacter tritici]
MDAVDNPSTPNAGALPETLIGRDEQTTAFRTLLRRLRRGRTEQSMIITGLRGVGKTVLLNSFRSIALEENWEVIEFEAVEHGEGRFCGPEPQKASDVAALLGRSSQQSGPTRAELIEMGLLFTPQPFHSSARFRRLHRARRRSVHEARRSGPGRAPCREPARSSCAVH